jgi:hypothetical protein
VSVAAQAVEEILSQVLHPSQVPSESVEAIGGARHRILEAVRSKCRDLDGWVS